MLGSYPVKLMAQFTSTSTVREMTNLVEWVPRILWSKDHALPEDIPNAVQRSMSGQEDAKARVLDKESLEDIFGSRIAFELVG